MCRGAPAPFCYAKDKALKVFKINFSRTDGKLTGDWNDTPKSRTLTAMKDFMKVLSKERCRTFHGGKSSASDSFKDKNGEYCIDYIAVDAGHATKAKVNDAYVTPDDVTSDHKPIAVVVELGK